MAVRKFSGKHHSSCFLKGVKIFQNLERPHDQCKVFMIFIRSNSLLPYNLLCPNHIGGEMVSLLTSIAVDHGFELQSSQTIYTYYYIKIGICCFSAMHTVLRCKSKDCLAQNHDNVSEWSSISTCDNVSEWSSISTCRLLFH